MGFWGSLFGGQNKTLNSDINQTGQIAGTASTLGTGNAVAGSKFWRDILSGDPTKVASTLAPEISSQQGQIAQQKKQNAEFGTRSGGTASANASADAAGRANIINLAGGLKSNAASTLLNSGENLLNTSLSGINQQAELSQEQMQNWSNSILGMGITKGVGFAEGFGLGKI